MKRLVILLQVLLACVMVSAKTEIVPNKTALHLDFKNEGNFKCEALKADVDKWNTLYAATCEEWAMIAKDSSCARFNSDGWLEYDYIIKADKSYDVDEMANVTLDYLSKQFNIVSANKSDMGNRDNLYNKDSKTIYFKGVVNKISNLQLVMSVYWISVDVVFNIRFKEDRIKFTVGIPYYKHFNGAFLSNTLIGDVYPFAPTGVSLSEKRNDNVVSAAFLMSIRNLMHYAVRYCNYMSENMTEW